MSGLEVVGSVASVIRLAAAVYSISKTLYEVGDALSNAPSDIKDLARDLETFSEELHLLSTLLDLKNSRYSDAVYRLIAKIIGDCATICQKIDRVLKKLRTTSFWSKVKWVYKEKEIMKLLARLRDLKLSLMGTLSLLGALKADTMMNAMGVGTSSLLEGTSNELCSRQTAKDLEIAEQKLAGIGTVEHPTTNFSIALASQQSWSSGASSATIHPPKTFQENSANTESTSPLSNVTFKPDLSISCSATPTQDSFQQTAVSSFEHEHKHSQVDCSTSWETITMHTSSKSPSSIADVLHEPSASRTHQAWRKEVVDIAIKHFNMTMEEAISWASSVPVPSIPGMSVQAASEDMAPRRSRESVQLPRNGFYNSSSPMVELVAKQSDDQLGQNWKKETILLAMKHFHMTMEQAVSWTASLPTPIPPERSIAVSDSVISSVCDSCALPREPRQPQIIFDGGGKQPPSRQGMYRMEKEREFINAYMQAFPNSKSPPFRLFSYLWMEAYLNISTSNLEVFLRLGHIDKRAKDLVPNLVYDSEPPRAATQAVTKLLVQDIDLDVGHPMNGDPNHEAILSSMKRIRDILQTIRGILEVGVIVWPCLCEAIVAVHKKRYYSLDHQNLYAALADVVTLVARYNVIERIYRQWQGMLVEEEYRVALVALCVRVLLFLDEVISNSAEMKAETLGQWMGKINEADASCRRFSVIIEDVFDEDSDSDGMICPIECTTKRKYQEAASRLESTKLEIENETSVKRQKL
ncbi:uncharacterized protein LY89DRAFT_734689 [Mollisia scopiformis]|uniref:Fungal N-terminal domain-containing protein n=1 Tax=Mollisia scopiformis TaxID=149040 RepID=A0A194X8U5_MOLSC|nr:uncharacterized protein LY89DRAFT_734689 [Mollisia scopiformis]KUJ16593.1 hypothetical protein LY89DRAFT_734689 [Mollisia scopiformis]